MRKLPLATFMIPILFVFAAVAMAAKTTVTYTPRPGAGPVFAVFDFPWEGGKAQPAPVAITGGVRRNFIAVPYGRCDQVRPSGFILKLKQPGQGTLKITTTGTLLRAPYQGDPPLETLHNCYRVQK